MRNTKFFTNQGNNTLKNIFLDILEDDSINIKYIEFLIGYFRISGFKQISQYLKSDSIESIKILVGLNIDKATYQATLIDENLNSEFIDMQSSILNSEPFSKNIDQSVSELSNLIKSKKLELRIVKNRDTHSKIYIFRNEPTKKRNGSIDYRGSVITGSSNLSLNGLEKNFEFNVELRDSADIEFATNEFARLWEDSSEVTIDDVDKIVKKSYLQKVTPYHLYLKLLIEYFDDRLDIDKNLSNLLPKEYIKLSYQEDAIIDALSKLRKHNGFILADVVGLGKTITVCWLLKRLFLESSGDVLIVIPPALKIQWGKSIDDFELDSFRKIKLITNGSLAKLSEDDIKNIEIVVVDESHKFKNSKSNMYKSLEKITKTPYQSQNKKVILVSATPLTNNPNDLKNQIYLFQNRRDSSIINYGNLEEFFTQIDKDYKEVISLEREDNPNRDIIKLKISNLSKKLNLFISNIVIRRTRDNLMKIDRYREDLKLQKINFPIVKVEELNYKLDNEFKLIYLQTLQILFEEFKYHRFLLRTYLKDKQKSLLELNSQDGFIDKSSSALAVLMRNLLIKRFESSKEAFLISLKKQKSNIEKLIVMANNDKIYISKNLDLNKVTNIDSIERDIQKLENTKAYTKDDFKVDIVSLLQEDLNKLDILLNRWNNLKQDPKLDKLISTLNSFDTNQKVVIFTESEDSLNYISSELSKDDKYKILSISNQNRNKKRKEILENFDANYDKSKQKNEYNIIITTDVLAEGINLHRAKYLINYDIPWNSTKLMQRLGRINRIGTEFEKVEIFNIKPEEISNEVIKLDEKAFRKIQTFHDTLGEDSIIYSNDETLNNDFLIELERDDSSYIDSELEFLEEIKSFRESNKKEFDRIKNLPNKIRVAQKSDNIYGSFVFKKINKSKEFNLIKDNQIEKISFLEMAQTLKDNLNQKEIKIDDNYYKDIDTLNNRVQKELIQTEKYKLTKIDKKAIDYLRGLTRAGFITLDKFTHLQNIISIGTFSDISRKILSIPKNPESTKKIDSIIDSYKISKPKKESEDKKQNSIEIILSSTFKTK